MTWPAWARIDADGVRVTWREPSRRIQLDDGFVRQAPPAGLTRIVGCDVWMEGDAHRSRFDEWVAGLGSGTEFTARLPPDGDAHRYRLVGGRGGVRWTGIAMREGGRWWRASITCIRPESDSTGLAEIPDQYWFRGANVSLVLPPLVGDDGNEIEGTSYSLTPAPPDGVVLDAATRTLAGTPTTVQQPALYTWRADDVAQQFRIGIGVSIWDAAIGDVSHVYMRASNVGNITDDHAAPDRSAGYPNRRVKTINPIKEDSRPFPIWPSGFVEGIAVPTIYVTRMNWEIVEHGSPLDNASIAVFIAVRGSIHGSRRQAVPGASVAHPESLQWCFRIRSAGQTDAEATQVTYFAGVDDPARLHDFGAVENRNQQGSLYIARRQPEAVRTRFLELQTIAKGVGARAEVALVWVGPGSVVRPDLFMTFLGGASPVA